jgi:hypothetical protein
MNIKKDLKLLITRNFGNALKKTENTYEYPKSSKTKMNTSQKAD